MVYENMRMTLKNTFKKLEKLWVSPFSRQKQQNLMNLQIMPFSHILTGSNYNSIFIYIL